jgi:hypothetical protein
MEQVMLTVPPIEMLSQGDIDLRKAEGYVDGVCPSCERDVMIGPRIAEMKLAVPDADLRCMLCAVGRVQLGDPILSLGGP